MRQSRLVVAAIALCGLSAAALAEEGDPGIERLSSPHGIEEVAGDLRAALEAKQLTLFTVIDHAANAQDAGLELPATRTFIFGNPKVGTPMMQCQGSMALDLPQKMVLRAGEEGTRLEWNDPHYLAERHGLGDCELPLDKVAGILEGLAQEAAGQEAAGQ